MITSMELIRQACDEKWIHPLAFYHQIKFQFVNSCLYDYRHRMTEISTILGVSKPTVYKYIKVLIDKQLVYVHSNNIIFKSIRIIKSELHDKRSCKVFLQDSSDIWYVTCRLYAKILEGQVRKIAFRESLRRFGKHELNKEASVERVFQPSFSIRNIAKVLNINEKTTKKVINTLTYLNVLEMRGTEPRKICKEKLPVNLFADFPGYLYVTKNGTFQQFGNKIELKEYPVHLPKITYKIYRKFYKSFY